jgi:hypothetical protein
MHFDVRHKMKLVGYWASEENPDLPDPHDLVCQEWLGADLERLIRYLTIASIARGSWGHSSCRFRCGIDDTEMGSRELTDGEWIWPEGLAHYVGHHDVVLPEAFVDHCRSRAWQPVTGDFASTGEIDDSFWRQWAAQKIKANKAWVDNPLPRRESAIEP